ncbi:MAG: hypothetical protein QNJ67_18230 [Kiloniellales bacterium]|nr:hypothetical protein [Kiloniellales bacterium]
MTEEPSPENTHGGAGQPRRPFGQRLRRRLFGSWRGLFQVYRPERHYMRGRQDAETRQGSLSR